MGEQYRPWRSYSTRNWIQHNVRNQFRTGDTDDVIITDAKSVDSNLDDFAG